MKIIITILFTVLAFNAFSKDCTFTVKNTDKIEVYSSSFTLDSEGTASASFNGIYASYSRDLTKQLETLTIIMPDGAAASPSETLDLLPRLSLIFVSSDKIEASLVCIK